MLSLLQESSEETHLYYLVWMRVGNDHAIRKIFSIYGYDDRLTMIFGNAALQAPSTIHRPCFLAIHALNEDKEEIIQSIETTYPEARMHRMTNAHDGGIIVFEIGETGWESTAGSD